MSLSLRSWKEIVFIQMVTGSISFASSSVIAFFVAFGKDQSTSQRHGLRNPYRRLIFGLSISDICQSFGLLAGPWMNYVPQAMWGTGNKHTCRFSGFVFLVGVTAVPMYTFCLCFYYVCKLKGQMTDTEFARKVEIKMHVVIIAANMGLYLAALGMDAINSSTNGTVCVTAAVPTGCRQNPEMFGECDPFISGVAQIYSLISSLIVPITSLLGIIGCLASIFWHVLTREKIFGQAHAIEDKTRTELQQKYMATGRRKKTIRHCHRSKTRKKPLRSANCYDFVKGEEVDATISFPPQNLDTSPRININCENNEEAGNKYPQGIYEDGHVSFQEQLDVAENGSACTTTVVPTQSSALDHHHTEHEHSDDVGIGNKSLPTQHQQSAENDVSRLSRQYKRELVTQACCYIFVFCMVCLPFLIVNLVLLSGHQPPLTLSRVTALLFPLGGFFNIIVYTRLNVASLRRRHPECSRLRAFWLVVRAGGEVPSDSEFIEASTWSCCRCNFLRNRTNHEDQDSKTVPQGQNTKQKCQEIMSDLQFGIISDPVACSTLPNFDVDISEMTLPNGDENMTLSLGSNKNMACPEVEGSRLNAIPEGRSSLESNDRLISRKDYSSNLSSFSIFQ